MKLVLAKWQRNWESGECCNTSLLRRSPGSGWARCPTWRAPLGPDRSPQGEQLHEPHVTGEEVEAPGKGSVTPKVAK